MTAISIVWDCALQYHIASAYTNRVVAFAKFLLVMNPILCLKMALAQPGWYSEQVTSQR